MTAFAQNADLADWLFLIAAICAVVAGLLALTARPDPTHGALVPATLALIAFGLLLMT